MTPAHSYPGFITLCGACHCFRRPYGAMLAGAWPLQHSYGSMEAHMENWVTITSLLRTNTLILSLREYHIAVLAATYLTRKLRSVLHFGGKAQEHHTRNLRKLSISGRDELAKYVFRSVTCSAALGGSFCYCLLFLPSRLRNWEDRRHGRYHRHHDRSSQSVTGLTSSDVIIENGTVSVTAGSLPAQATHGRLKSFLYPAAFIPVYGIHEIV